MAALVMYFDYFMWLQFYSLNSVPTIKNNKMLMSICLSINRRKMIH